MADVRTLIGLVENLSPSPPKTAPIPATVANVPRDNQLGIGINRRPRQTSAAPSGAAWAPETVI